MAVWGQSSGHKNISKRADGRWCVSMMYKHHLYYGGLFWSLDEALEVRNRLAQELHDKYGRKL